MFWESEIYYNNWVLDDVKIKTHRKCSTLTNKQKYIITFNNQILYGFFFFFFGRIVLLCSTLKTFSKSKQSKY